VTAERPSRTTARRNQPAMVRANDVAGPLPSSQQHCQYVPTNSFHDLLRRLRRLVPGCRFRVLALGGWAVWGRRGGDCLAGVLRRGGGRGLLASRRTGGVPTLPL
jgi:hypothetical protein